MTIGQGPQGQSQPTAKPNACSRCVAREDRKDYSAIDAYQRDYGRQLTAAEVMSLLKSRPNQVEVRQAEKGGLCESCRVQEREDRDRRRYQQERQEQGARRFVR